LLNQGKHFRTLLRRKLDERLPQPQPLDGFAGGIFQPVAHFRNRSVIFHLVPSGGYLRGDLQLVKIQSAKSDERESGVLSRPKVCHGNNCPGKAISESGDYFNSKTSPKWITRLPVVVLRCRDSRSPRSLRDEKQAGCDFDSCLLVSIAGLAKPALIARMPGLPSLLSDSSAQNGRNKNSRSLFP
jgi:hypothetical protein